MKGYFQIYTGNGKGKTTAAIGLALRAVGAGKKVFIGQFVKSQVYSEIHALKQYLPQIEVKQFGRGCFIINNPVQEDIDKAREGLQQVKQIIEQGEYDVVILDEANIALYYKLFDCSELMEMIKSRPEQMEIVVTGRYAPEELIEMADLVTEMKPIKHYYDNGVEAREGIEC